MNKISKRQIKEQEKALKELDEILDKANSKKDFFKYSLLIEKYISISDQIRNNYIPPLHKQIYFDAYYVKPRSINVPFFFQQRHVIDLFSGIGNLSHCLKNQKHLKYTLIDIDEDALNIAKKLNMLNKEKIFFYKEQKYIESEYSYIVKDIFEISTDFLKNLLDPDILPFFILNPPFSKNIKNETLNLISNLFETAPDGSLFWIILPSSWKKDLNTLINNEILFHKEYLTNIYFINNSQKAQGFFYEKDKPMETYNDRINIKQLSLSII